ncbi:hypothetical protein J3E68DRAFT_402878 [Trichoderma sp. SZMC 28012]
MPRMCLLYVIVCRSGLYRENDPIFRIRVDIVKVHHCRYFFSHPPPLAAQFLSFFQLSTPHPNVGVKHQSVVEMEKKVIRSSQGPAAG